MMQGEGKNKNKQTRGRFAPSPSGRMHLGNAWTALLAWLDIRKQQGTMVLRIEDLDPGRSRPEFAAGLIEDLHWLGLDWDEGPDVGGPFSPYRQSERSNYYLAAFEKLFLQGLVYPCYCSRAELRSAASAPHAGDLENPYPGRCLGLDPKTAARFRAGGRKPAFRLRVHDTAIRFTDSVCGSQHQVLSEVCGDFAIRRSDGVFAYQFAVVVDDLAMEIDRIVRGGDLLSSTPRQIYLCNLLGQRVPDYSHVPLLYGEDGHRLSKRNGDLAIASLRETGISPEMIVGRLAAWAGLIEKFEPVRPRDLVSAYDVSCLPVQPVIVKESVFGPI